MESFVDQSWVEDLDFSQAETLDKSFVSEHYKTTESDLIYRLPYGDDEIYVYVLLEFQSTVDPWMALRVLNYITNFYMDYVESGKAAGTKTGKGDGKLPPIFPVVLYNGDRRWTAATEIADLIRQQPSLDEYALRFEYFKIAENEYSRDLLLSIHNIVSTLFLTEAQYDREDVIRETLALFESEDDKRAFSLFLNWYRQLFYHGGIDEDDYEEFEQEYRSKKEVRTMLITALEKEREALRKEGLEEGRAEIVRAMYEHGLALSVIAGMTGMALDEIQALIESGNGQVDPESKNSNNLN